MARFWWVNHKKTFKDELEGGYLWSPKNESSGARSQFYENMRLTRPGDGILSYANGVLKAIGVIADFAIAAPKPSEFGARGAQWSMDGWLVPVAWQLAKAPVKPKDFLAELGPLLPTKYSPLNRDTGNGNQKAYLSEISNDAFELCLSQLEISSFSSLASPLSKLAAHSSRDFIEEFESSIEASIHSSEDLTRTNRIQLVLARRGQGLFRRNVSLIESACRCTGINTPQLLIASHIKPWRYCDNSHERLDGHNGLFLSPNADLLFDRGLISFSDNGDLIISSSISKTDLLRLGISAENVGSFLPSQKIYLSYHRTHILVQ